MGSLVAAVGLAFVAGYVLGSAFSTRPGSPWEWRVTAKFERDQDGTLRAVGWERS